jgi:hypothetical protein
MRRFVSVLGAMSIAVGCATNWVHPDPEANWDAAYADCLSKAEAADSGEMDEQVMNACLEEKGWVEEQPSRSRRSGTPRPRSRRTPRPY